MSHVVKSSNVDCYSFIHSFSDKDWEALQELKGKTKGTVKLTDGPATADGKLVHVTLKSPGGVRIYSIPAKDLFK